MRLCIFFLKNRWQINLIKHVDNFNKCRTAIDCLIRSTDAVETRNGLILAALGQRWGNVGTVLTRLCGSGAQARTHGGEGNPEETQSHPSSRSAPLGPLLQFQQSVGSIITSSLSVSFFLPDLLPALRLRERKALVWSHYYMLRYWKYTPKTEKCLCSGSKISIK